MDGREGGFIKVFRRIESWPLYKSLRTGEQCHVVTILLLMAAWKPSSVWISGHPVEVKRGQILASEETIAARAKTSRKVVRTMLAKLEREGFVTRHVVAINRIATGSVQDCDGRETGPSAGPSVTVLTVVNYDDYQGGDEKEGPKNGQARASLGPATGQPGAPSEEGEEEEEERNLCAEDASGASPPARAPATQVPLLALVEPPSPVVTVMPCVGKGPREFAVTEALVAEWQEAFPAVDVLSKVRVLAQWARDNPKKRKTHAGARSFFSRCLASEQDKRAPAHVEPPTKSKELI